MARRSGWMILAGLSGAIGCSSAPSVDGMWTGTWLASGAAGNVTFDLHQSDEHVTGTTAFTGSPCFSAGGLTGTAHGTDFFGSVTAGQIRVDFDATIAGDELDGTFTAIAAGPCTGSTGSFRASP